MRRSSTSPPAERGIALLVVVSVLTVIAVMGVSFLFSMNLETQAARHFSEATKARYLAEGGIAVARALLDEDRLGSRIDELTESWVSHFAGSDVDIDANRTNDARWWLLDDPAGEVAGRYAVLIKDEAGKANLNTAVADPAASGIDAVNLTTLLTQAGIANASSLARAIEEYRYGPDARPGVALVDDDRDGTVDEPDEYQALALRGDDRRFENLEEILSLGGLDVTGLRTLATVATVYSWDTNLNLAGTARVNLNTATAEELLTVMLERGADDPWQMAANMADYADMDLAISRVSKSVIRSDLTDQGPLGDWRWEAASPPPGYYTSQTANGSALRWEVTVPLGSFRILVHGLPGMKVGDVDLNGQHRPSMDSGEAFGVMELGGSLSVQVTHREPDGTRCALQGIELVPADDISGSQVTPVSVRGVEAIRFNELMVSPTMDLTVSSAVFDPQTSAWTCTGGACSNSGAGQARWSWTSSAVRPGQYYVWVYGQSGQTVGEVRVDGQSSTLVHGQRHPKTLTVGSDQKVSLTIGKTPADGTYRFQRLVLSLEPDAEYVELINLSGTDVDVSGWIIEGDAAGGRQARLPAGSLVKPHGMLVVAVDGDDSQEGLDGNGIEVRAAWELPTDAAWVQLEFIGGNLTPDSDWLNTAVGSGSARLVLRANEWIVDEVEYLLPLSTTAPFQSLEKGDPSVVRDTDRDGLDEGWYPALRLYTPGARNDNEGLRELRGLEQIVHDPSTEITLLNRPLRSVGELAGLPSGIAWRVVTSGDLAKIVDRLTVDGLRLETEGHLLDTDGWRETADGYETSRQGSVGTWQWVDVPDGQYRLSLYGWAGEQLTVRWQRRDGSYTDWIPVRSMDAQGRIVVGQVTVGLEESPAHTLTLQARCESPGGVCHLQHLWLDPQLTLLGMVNVNTAQKKVLLSLPGMTELIVDRLIAGRPYGDKEEKARGIGDLLVGSILGDAEADKLARFRQVAHLVTIRSQVFEILSLGEAVEDERSGASQRIQAIVQR